MKISQMYYWVFSILLCVGPHFSYADSREYTIIEDKAKLPILTPALSERKIAKIRLPNGLEALIISDPKADKSAASLSVDVGSWNDPKEHPGIAHFLEHMLFLGTKKFPNESEYDHFIHAHGGNTNAYTASTQTSYMFSVDNQAFLEALDRFSSFFKEPLFLPSGVARELHAIDQEYAKNLENDSIRTSYVSKELGIPDHPFHNFHIGNSQTLSQTSQEALKEWYRKHYSANLMHLIVYSPLPIDDLTRLVVEDFQGVPNSNAISFSLDKTMLSNTYRENMIYIEPVQDIRSLVILWELPVRFVEMKEEQPDLLVCSVLGHEGEESLLAQLKREQLAESLECGVEKLSSQHWILQIEIGLTNEGVTQVNHVIEQIFQAIARFKSTGVPAYIFDEVQSLAKINYQYQSREDAFANMMRQTRYITQEPLSTYPERTLIVQKYNPIEIRNLLDVLTPKNAQFYLVAPSAITGVIPDRKEKWVGVSYSVKPLDKNLLEKWSRVDAHPQVTLPAPNKFIPKNLELIKTEMPVQKSGSYVPIPELISNTDRGMIYYAADNRYKVPQVYMGFEIKTPQIDMGDATKVVLADLFVKSLKDSLTDVSYPATMAGLRYHIKRSDFGLLVSVEGYQEHAGLLLEEIMKHLKNISITPQQFEVFKNSLLRDYQNASKDLSIMQTGDVLKQVINKKFSTDKQKAVAIEQVTYDQFNQYVTKLFSRNYIQGMLYGNITKQDGEQLSNIVLKTFEEDRFPEGKNTKPSIIILPDNKGPYYIEETTQAQGNAAILGIEETPFSFKKQAAQNVLMQAIKGPFFAALRTQQQTGYIVFNYGTEVEEQLFDLFAVQSNTHDPRDLLARFEMFIEGFMQEINNALPEQLFETIRQTLLHELEEPPKSIQEMGELLQKLAFKYEGDFERVAKRIQALKELTYAELIQSARKSLGKENRRRVAILMKGTSPDENVFQYTTTDIPHLQQVSDYSR